MGGINLDSPFNVILYKTALLRGTVKTCQKKVSYKSTTIVIFFSRKSSSRRDSVFCLNKTKEWSYYFDIEDVPF